MNELLLYIFVYSILLKRKLSDKGGAEIMEMEGRVLYEFTLPRFPYFFPLQKLLLIIARLKKSLSLLRNEIVLFRGKNSRLFHSIKI